MSRIEDCADDWELSLEQSCFMRKMDTKQGLTLVASVVR